MDSSGNLGEYYHFRCFTDISGITDESMVNFLKENTKLILVVSEFSHGGGRKHIHATLQLFKAVNTFRDKLRKSFPMIFGNKSYSISKVRDYDSNIKYCLKGTVRDFADVLFTTIDKEMEKQYYYEYWELQDEIRKAKSKSKDEVNMGCQNDPSANEVKMPKQRVKSKTWKEKVHTYIVDSYPDLVQVIEDYYTWNGKTDLDKDVFPLLTSIVMRKLGELAMNLDEMILTRLVNAQFNALVNLCSIDAQNEYHKSCYETIKYKLLGKKQNLIR